MYNLVLRLVRNRDDAADITQEAFVRAYRAWDGFDGRCKPYTWLCQIAINLCRNRARDKKHWDDEPVEDHDIISPEPGPEESLQRAQLEDKIRQAMDELPGNYRIVTVLRDMQGLTYQEIAEAAGLSVDVVKTRLARGRRILRKKLQTYL